MKKELLNILCCPSCGQGLDLRIYQESGATPGPADAPGGKAEVTSGLLKCACGNSYPVVEGVPRLIEGVLANYPEFLRTFGPKIESDICLSKLGSNMTDRELKNDFDGIRKSYSRAWSLFDYAEDKTWGWTLGERQKVFLSDVGLTQDELRGQLLLDAGCGNGTLSALLGTLGPEVVGIDLNDGLGLANGNRTRYAGDHWTSVQFVQGNLFFPPVKPDTFDLIYCSGMVHRTPNPKESFQKLVPLVKKGGRLYIWVTGTRSIPVRLFKWSGMQLKRFMSLDSVLLVCRGIAPLYKLAAESFDKIGIIEFRKRNVREVTLDLFESFAPRYSHWHTEEEIQGWFKDQGFVNIHLSGRQKHGFGVYGDRI
ncbi:MAG: methyltransferase domain-containing protein [Candidatus Acidiferrales bacterium]